MGENTININYEYMIAFYGLNFELKTTWPIYGLNNIHQITLRSESAFFFFILDPDFVLDYFKTRLTNKELDEGGRCSHLKQFDEKYQIAECCITDLPEGLRHSDFPKRKFSCIF